MVETWLESGRLTRLSPHLKFICSGGMISTINSQPLLLLPESPASDESFTLAHILENLPMSFPFSIGKPFRENGFFGLSHVFFFARQMFTYLPRRMVDRFSSFKELCKWMIQRKDREILTFFTSVTTFSHYFFLFLCDRKTNEIRKIGGRLDDKVGCFREQ